MWYRSKALRVSTRGADPRVSGQELGDRRRHPSGADALVETVRDGPRTEGLAGHGVHEGRIEFPRVVLVEEPEQGGRLPRA